MKTLDEILARSGQEDGMRSKLASLENAHKAGDVAEFKKIADSLDFNDFSGPVIDRILDMSSEMAVKKAEDTPGLPAGANPSEEPKPTETSSAVVTAKPTPEGEESPEVKDAPEASGEQAPGTSPAEEPPPADVLPDNIKSAFVIKCAAKGIQIAAQKLIKAAADKRAKNPVKLAEAMINELVAEYGEEKTAAFVSEAQQRGFAEASEKIFGGSK